MKGLSFSLDASRSEDSPLVSIVIPCYMQAHFLREAIESCLRQTYSNLQVIVVDDGSPDNTAAVASSFDDVKYVRQENQGLHAARNRGLQESTGEYVVFLDSDDRLRPNAVESGLNHLLRHPKAAFAYGRCELINFDGSIIGPSPQPTVKTNHYCWLLSRNIISHPGVILFRRGPLEEAGGFHPGITGAEDYDLSLRLARIYEISGYDEVVSDYRQHEGGMSRKASIMSESIGRVLKAQAPYVQGSRQRKKALKAGMRRWRRNYYADSLVLRVNENVRQKRWKAVAQDLPPLFRANPYLLLENAGRKLKIELKKLSVRKQASSH